MRTLNATLQANQDGNRRSPLVEILSGDPTNAIPFDGTVLTTETINESDPCVLVHSLGRLVGCYIYGPSGSLNNIYDIRYFYTDAGKTTFTIVPMSLYNGSDAIVIKNVSICEMANGNIAIVWLEDNQSDHNYYIKYQILTVTGTKVSNGTIDSWLHDYYSDGIAVIYNPLANEYLVVTAGEYETPTEYVVYTITSTDFQTWGDRGIVADATPLKWSSPALMYDASHATFWLWITVVDGVGGSGEERTNVYYATSPDGATWTLGGAMTAYDDFATIGNHGRSVMKSATEMYAIWTQEQKSLMVNENADGWLSPSTGGGIGVISQLHFDATNRKLYITACGYSGIAVNRVDVDAWEIDAAWSYPNGDFHQIFGGPAFGYSLGSINSGHYIAVHTLGQMNRIFVQILDGENDLIIRNYAFGSWPVYSITQNVTATHTYGLTLCAVQIDLTSDKVWFFSHLNWQFIIGYIPFSTGSLTYTEHIVCADCNPGVAGTAKLYLNVKFKVYPEYGYILVYGNDTNVQQGAGFCSVYNLATGVLIKNYYVAAYPGFPERGLECAEIYNGKIYAGFDHSTYYSQGSNYGLVVIDLTTDAMICHRPTFATVDDYGFTDIKVMADGRMLITSSVYGLIIYDPALNTWVNYSNANNPGFTTPADDEFNLLEYDETGELIFTTFGALTDQEGVLAISTYGAFKESFYKIGTYSAGAWTWGKADNMVLENNTYDLEAAMDSESGTLYAFGVFKDIEETSIWWDTEAPAFDLAPFWMRDSGLELTWTIDGDPGKLEFTITHGHLFDPYNLASLYRKYVDKGRKISVRLGELIGGVEYWENQGTYWIIERKMEGYQRGKLPTLKITAEDMRTLWKFKEIIASAEYSDDPTDIIEGLIIAADSTVDAGDFSWPTIDNETTLYHQWVETALLDAIQQILDRYGYFLKITRDDKIAAGKIALDNAITHTYGDSTQILNFTPDDTFSDFTNQVAVVGQERAYTEVVYAEELIKTLSGTCGWYGFENDFIVYYSDDQSARFRSPRLFIVESASTIAFDLAGGVDESITSVDTNEKYCVVTVSAPDLRPPLVIQVSIYLAAAWIPDIVVAFGFIANGGFTIPVGRFVQALAMVIILNITSSIGNFQYEIHGLPVGYVRRSVQATANDFELQGQIGKVISTKIESEFCYTTEDCQLVANHERDVLKGQRKRLTFDKVSHLQDEEGDTISVIHPYSGQAMTVFITDLKRTYRVPSGVKEEASCVDKIEGWYVS